MAESSISSFNEDKSLCLVYLRRLPDGQAFVIVTFFWKKKNGPFHETNSLCEFKIRVLKSTPALDLYTPVLVCSVRNTWSAIYFQSVCPFTFKTDFFHILTYSKWLRFAFLAILTSLLFSWMWYLPVTFYYFLCLSVWLVLGSSVFFFPLNYFELLSYRSHFELISLDFSSPLHIIFFSGVGSLV